ncbi:MAG: hypothetical protein M1813_005363 [Trichoglossum hirsutum]|nr:MAG: hypothetical protein M1813_005363 [Trichoglossum hirsutum]
MSAVNSKNSLKPCEFFDIIGGTSTGGLIAIILGRLKMSISSCIDAYIQISKSVFMKQERYITWLGKIRGRFEEDTLFLDTGAECKAFVCAVRKEKRQIAILRSYVSPRNRSQVLQDCRIWEAARATSAATPFFKPVSIGALKMEFLDGAVSCNNPVEQLYTEALDIWPDMEERLSCLVSIGTEMQLLKPFGDSVRGV